MIDNSDSTVAKRKVAILLASYNRKTSTLNALSSAKKFFPSTWTLDFFLTDDGSTDGTAEAVREVYPDVNLVIGTGNWYWSKSMAAAENSIVKKYDAILWLNDDVKLHKSHFEKFLTTHERYPDSILVGQFCDADSGSITYGGYLRTGRNPLKLIRIQSQDLATKVDTFNGNFVWVPWHVKQKLVCIDGGFSHAYGDLDYGYRASRSGISSYIIPGFIGQCRLNEVPKKNSRFNEIVRLRGPKGLPLSDQWKFHRNHSGFFAPWFSILPYLRILLTGRY